MGSEMCIRDRQKIKRLIDVTVSIFSLIILSPLLIFAALRVKFSSEGPVFYSQERIGYKGHPFRMYKFCLLYTSDAADERSSVDLGGRRIIKKKTITCYSVGMRVDDK